VKIEMLERRERLRQFRYVLEDFLGIKAALQAKQTEPVTEFLLSQGLEEYHLTPVEGLHLPGQLILIAHINPHSVENLIFLRPGDGRVRIRRLSE